MAAVFPGMLPHAAPDAGPDLCCLRHLPCSTACPAGCDACELEGDKVRRLQWPQGGLDMTGRVGMPSIFGSL